MPTIIIHEMGKEPRVQRILSETIRVGRDKDVEVPLPNVSVSRQHLQLVADAGTWFLEPLATDNPVILDGQIQKDRTALVEGAEIQVGRYLLIFSFADGEVKKGYKEQRQYQVEGECPRCQWRGVVSIYNKRAVCPACGMPEIRRVEKAAPDPAAELAFRMAAGATAAVSPQELQRLAARMTAAKFARIVHVESEKEWKLSDGEAFTFGREGEATYGLSGLQLGAASSLCWERDRWIVRRGGFWPRLKVNGKGVDKKALKNGDEFTIGGETFRLLLE